MTLSALIVHVSPESLIQQINQSTSDLYTTNVDIRTYNFATQSIISSEMFLFGLKKHFPIRKKLLHEYQVTNKETFRSEVQFNVSSYSTELIFSYL